ncbi:hypothetical protein PC116_g30407 [Phytophthora cactorum]|nr:hypothetical protein PC116_g30407 [Phytophthora cactorum]
MLLASSLGNRVVTRLLLIATIDRDHGILLGLAFRLSYPMPFLSLQGVQGASGKLGLCRYIDL